MSDPTPTVPTPWYRRSSVAALWKTLTGFVITGLSGGMSWSAVGISSAIATLMASTDILFGADSYRAAG